MKVRTFNYCTKIRIAERIHIGALIKMISLLETPKLSTRTQDMQATGHCMQISDTKKE